LGNWARVSLRASDAKQDRQRPHRARDKGPSAENASSQNHHPVPS
jgi:hypothetical protein